MTTLIKAHGLYGIVVALGLPLGLFLILWWVARKDSENGSFQFDALGERGSFEKQLTYYFDVAKTVVGLASGSIVVLVGSAAFHSNGNLSSAFASPLFLLAQAIVCGVLFMGFISVDYEAYRHAPKRDTYTAFKYARDQALGFGSLFCFCIAYVWLIAGVVA